MMTSRKHLQTKIVDHFAGVAQVSWCASVDALPKQKGYYVLWLNIRQSQDILVGKKGWFYFQQGDYFYVGSAMGQGGIASRVARHWRNDDGKKKRWHIDFIRVHSDLIGAWVFTEFDQTNHLECQLAQFFSSLPNSKEMALGASDCDCLGHVLFMS